MQKLLSACIGLGRYWQGLDLNRILNQGLVCELWRDLLTLMPVARDPKSGEDQTSTADCFSTRQSRLCHGPGSNTSENTKTRLPVPSSSSNKSVAA